jgi:hypothetical protein
MIVVLIALSQDLPDSYERKVRLKDERDEIDDYFTSL